MRADLGGLVTASDEAGPWLRQSPCGCGGAGGPLPVTGPGGVTRGIALPVTIAGGVTGAGARL